MLSVLFAGLGYGGVLCLIFPWLLTTPDARPLYPLAVVRLLIHAFLVAAGSRRRFRGRFYGDGRAWQPLGCRERWRW